MQVYRPRIVDKILKRKLEGKNIELNKVILTLLEGFKCEYLPFMFEQKSCVNKRDFVYSLFIKFFWMLKNKSKRVMFSLLRGHK